MLESSVPIRSVSRSLSVLRTINQYGCISVVDIARYEALPYPTTFRIVQTLIHEGLIERENSSKRYRPTALVKSLASGYEEVALRAVAQDHMSELTRECGWPILLSHRVGARMVIEATTHRETTLTTRNWESGASMPLATSATGHMWLAHLPEQEIQDFIRWGISERIAHEQDADPDLCLPSSLAIDEDTLLKILPQIREQGYAWRPSFHDDDIKTASLAAPIFRNGMIAGVLTLTYFASAMKQSTAIEKLLAPLKNTADAISQELSRTH